MAYTDIIATTEIQDVRLTVLKGDLLKVDMAKVLPTNEFFNTQDSDWESPTPRSIMGQYLKQLSLDDHAAIQNKIDETLGRVHQSGQVGYPFGQTIVLKQRNDILLFTITVKYEMQAIQERSRKIVAKLERERYLLEERREYYEREKYYPERETHHHLEREWLFPHEIDQTQGKLQVYYDTFLVAIGQCVENIIKATQEHRIEKVAVPLLGAGWGGLHEEAVFSTMLDYFSKSIRRSRNIPKVLSFLRKGNYPKELYLVLPYHTSVDRQLVLRSLRDTSLFEGASEASDQQDGLTMLETVKLIRLYEDEIAIAGDRIENYKSIGEEAYMPSFLLDRKASLERELEQIKKLLLKSEIVIEGDQIMGDKYTVGQAGAVGPHSHAHDMTFNQIWNQASDNIDLPMLADDLSKLRSKLKEKATEPEHDTAVGEVAAAETAAKKGNGPVVLEHLAKAGKWALDVATDIGAKIAVEALKKALGL